MRLSLDATNCRFFVLSVCSWDPQKKTFSKPFRLVPLPPRTFGDRAKLGQRNSCLSHGSIYSDCESYFGTYHDFFSLSCRPNKMWRISQSSWSVWSALMAVCVVAAASAIFYIPATSASPVPGKSTLKRKIVCKMLRVLSAVTCNLFQRICITE